MTTKTPKSASTDKAEKKAPAKSRASTKAAAADKPVVRYVVEKPIVFKPANDVDSFTGRKRVRRSFGKIREVAQMPNLIEVQRQSYEAFLQAEVVADNRKMQGLHEVFSSVFPIKDFSDRAEIDYVKY